MKCSADVFFDKKPKIIVNQSYEAKRFTENQSSSVKGSNVQRGHYNRTAMEQNMILKYYVALHAYTARKQILQCCSVTMPKENVNKLKMRTLNKTQ